VSDDPPIPWAPRRLQRARAHSAVPLPPTLRPVVHLHRHTRRRRLLRGCQRPRCSEPSRANSKGRLCWGVALEWWTTSHSWVAPGTSWRAWHDAATFADPPAAPLQRDTRASGSDRSRSVRQLPSGPASLWPFMTSPPRPLRCMNGANAYAGRLRCHPSRCNTTADEFHELVRKPGSKRAGLRLFVAAIQHTTRAKQGARTEMKSRSVHRHNHNLPFTSLLMFTRSKPR
jgi:hypothetical protein